jgi:hypothetical protein
MPYLSEEQVRQAFPDAAQPSKLHLYNKLTWWNEIIIPALPIPVLLPFNENIRTSMPLNIRNGKGLYFFCIEPDHPINISLKYLVYVGRVLGGEADNHNFFLRFAEYVNAIGDVSVKRNTMRMTNLWPEKTHVYFFDLNYYLDDDIKELEDLFIQKIVPPLNEKLKGSARQTRLLH